MKPSEYLSESERTVPADYSKMLERLAEPGVAELNQAIMGMVKEAGELQDAMYKWLIYGVPLDLVNIKEELGDSQWYHALAIRAVDSSYEQIWERNIQKLRVRYPNKFSEEKAANRDLKSERAALEGIKVRCVRCGMERPAKIASGGCIRGTAHDFGEA